MQPYRPHYSKLSRFSFLAGETARTRTLIVLIWSQLCYQLHHVLKWWQGIYRASSEFHFTTHAVSYACVHSSCTTYLVCGAGFEPAQPKPKDFKSFVSTVPPPAHIKQIANNNHKLIFYVHDSNQKYEYGRFLHQLPAQLRLNSNMY